MASQTTFVDLYPALRALVYVYVSPNKRFIAQAEERECILARTDAAACYILENVAKQVWESKKKAIAWPIGLLVDRQIEDVQQYFNFVTHFVFCHFPDLRDFHSFTGPHLTQCASVIRLCDQKGHLIQPRLSIAVQAMLTGKENKSLAQANIQKWLEIGAQPSEEVFLQLCRNGNSEDISYNLNLFFQTDVQVASFLDKGDAIFRALLLNPALASWGLFFDILHRHGAQISFVTKLLAILKHPVQAAGCFFLQVPFQEICNLGKSLGVACLKGVISSFPNDSIVPEVYELSHRLIEMEMGGEEIALLKEAHAVFGGRVEEFVASFEERRVAPSLAGVEGWTATLAPLSAFGNAAAAAAMPAFATASDAVDAGQWRAPLSPKQVLSMSAVLGGAAAGSGEASSWTVAHVPTSAFGAFNAPSFQAATGAFSWREPVVQAVLNRSDAAAGAGTNSAVASASAEIQAPLQPLRMTGIPAMTAFAAAGGGNTGESTDAPFPAMPFSKRVRDLRGALGFARGLLRMEGSTLFSRQAVQNATEAFKAAPENEQRDLLDELLKLQMQSAALHVQGNFNLNDYRP